MAAQASQAMYLPHRAKSHRSHQGSIRMSGLYLIEPAGAYYRFGYIKQFFKTKTQTK